MAPVRLAMARWVRVGSLPASHAITASTANSGSVCSHASRASATPCEMRNCAASAPQATRNAESRMLGNVHKADAAEPPAADREATSFRRTVAEDNLQCRERQAMARCTVTRRVHFNAAHRLWNPAFSPEQNERVFGVCNNPNFHGHNYNLDVSVEGEIDAPTGYVLDIARLKDIVTECLLRHLDHKNLNLDVPWVKDVIGDAIFHEKHENMICVRDIEIYSLCEHHLLPFFGRAHVAYLPNGKIVGLSKIPRVVEVFARRLQVQERLTDQVADALMRVLQPQGVGVVIEAFHLCMMMRGVEKQNSKTVTSALRGAFRDDAKTRDEFLRLVHGGNWLA